MSTATRIPEDIVDAVKEAVTLEQVLVDMYGKDIHDNKVTCDFHGDTNPSLHIFPDGGYKCFVCGAGKKGQELTLQNGTKIIDGGNSIFGYVMNKECVTFPEAVRILGNFAGINVPVAKPDPEADRMKQVAMAKNRDFYQALMKDQVALDYLKERGIGIDEIAKWRLGMVPWDWADKRYAGRIVFGLMEESYQAATALTIAMAYRIRKYEDYVKHGWLKDEIDKSLMSKYHEDGRLKSINPKYYNDSKSKIYNKSSYLYGMTYAQEALRAMEPSKRFVVLMEGYTDVILAHKNGVETAIASCGTSVTDEQVEMISRKCKRVYLWLDGDAAGVNAMTRALPKFLAAGCEVLIVQSPGMDPADVVMSGENLSRFIVQNAKHAVQLIINKELEEFDKMVNMARTRVLDSLLPLVDSISRPSERINYQSVVETRLNVRL